MSSPHRGRKTDGICSLLQNSVVAYDLTVTIADGVFLYHEGVQTAALNRLNQTAALIRAICGGNTVTLVDADGIQCPVFSVLCLADRGRYDRGSCFTTCNQGDDRKYQDKSFHGCLVSGVWCLVSGVWCPVV